MNPKPRPPIEAYLELRERPVGRPLMHHRWRDLSFLHYSLDPEVVQARLPEGLEVDTFPGADGRERAWIGVVPFRMEGIRFHRAPAVPGLSAFPETNVRTYVHRRGRRPGVWFFSLDAANFPACRYGRLAYALPYFEARMSAERREETVRYRSARVFDRRCREERFEVELGEAVETPAPGTLEFFLIERYLLYAARRGKLLEGLVHHQPYPVRQAKILEAHTTLPDGASLPRAPWEHVMFSDGVDVEVFGVRGVR
jgi:uncharacterized protein